MKDKLRLREPIENKREVSKSHRWVMLERGGDVRKKWMPLSQSRRDPATSVNIAVEGRVDESLVGKKETRW